MRLKIALYEKKKSEVPEEQQNRTISEVLRYLQEHLEEEISLNVLADKFHLSLAYISQLKKTRSG